MYDYFFWLGDIMIWQQGVRKYWETGYALTGCKIESINLDIASLWKSGFGQEGLILGEQWDSLRSDPRRW